jgi:FG-GAP repeat protein
MKLIEDQVRIEVSDEGAIFPVTIDTTFTQQQKLVASDAEAFDLFGASVAISGDTVVVGATGDVGVAGADQGSAYVFVRSGGVWSQQQKLEASDTGVKGGRERTLPLPDDVRSAVKEYLKLDESRRLNLHSDGNDAYLFPSRAKGSRPRRSRPPLLRWLRRRTHNDRFERQRQF